MDHGPKVSIVRHPTLADNMPSLESCLPSAVSPHLPISVGGLPAVTEHVLKAVGRAHVDAHVIRLLGRHPEHIERHKGVSLDVLTAGGGSLTVILQARYVVMRPAPLCVDLPPYPICFLEDASCARAHDVQPRYGLRTSHPSLNAGNLGACA